MKIREILPHIPGQRMRCRVKGQGREKYDVQYTLVYEDGSAEAVIIGDDGLSIKASELAASPDIEILEILASGETTNVEKFLTIGRGALGAAGGPAAGVVARRIG